MVDHSGLERQAVARAQSLRHDVVHDVERDSFRGLLRAGPIGREPAVAAAVIRLRARLGVALAGFLIRFLAGHQPPPRSEDAHDSTAIVRKPLT